MDTPPQKGDAVVLLATGDEAMILKSFYMWAPGVWRISYDTPDGPRGCLAHRHNDEWWQYDPSSAKN